MTVATETTTGAVPPPAEEEVIVVNKMNKWYGNFHVLKDIDLSVRKGERIVICGPSGSGKSTLIRTLNRLETYQSGEITVDGIFLGDDVKNIEAVRREVCMVFQHFNLFPHMTVLENLTLAPIWVRKMPKKDANDLAMHYLERVRIAEQAHKYPGQLSGGQQQRVAIARSLCMQPKIMLFDEPTSALDPETIEEVTSVIRSLALKHSYTMLMVTHQIDFAHDISDRICFFDKGRIIEQGPPASVINAPTEPRTQQFLSKVAQAR